MTPQKKGKAAASKAAHAKQTSAGGSTKDLDSLLSSLQEKFGEGSVMRLGEVSKVNVSVVSTVSFSH